MSSLNKWPWDGASPEPMCQPPLNPRVSIPAAEMILTKAERIMAEVEMELARWWAVIEYAKLGA